MARPNSPKQKAWCIQQIIDLTLQNSRLTVKVASEILGLNRNTTCTYFREAAARGGLVRHGRCGLFRDQRAVIDFDLQSFSSARTPAFCPPVSFGPVASRVRIIYGAMV